MSMARSAKKEKKPVKPKWQTHVYLDEIDFTLLKEIAERESRSTTMQIQHFIREGLAKHRQR